jgi:hypothetical protein
VHSGCILRYTGRFNHTQGAAAMDELSLKKAKMTAEIATILKQSKILALQKHKDAHSDRLARDAAQRVEKIREAIQQIDAEIAVRNEGKAAS